MNILFDRPAGYFGEALPVGCGRLGAMIYGRTDTETVPLNEDSIWSGPEQSRVNPDAVNDLERIRSLILAGRIPEAEQLALYSLSGVPNSQRSYVPAGECVLHFCGDCASTEYENYFRRLSLDTGTACVTYSVGGTVYTRNCFASYPAGVIVINMTARERETGRPAGGLSLDVRLDRCHNRANTVRVLPEDDTLLLSGGCEGGETPFTIGLRARQEGGSIESVGEFLVIRGAFDVTLYISTETAFRGERHEQRCLSRLASAAAKGFQVLYDGHLADYKALFGRVSLRLGPERSGTRPEPENLMPTERRLERLREGYDDPALFALYFQYARFLLISSSRPGSLPANLQGVWNDMLQPPWDSKYTININTQMNYWPAESCALPECHMPLFDMLERVKENGKLTARDMYGCRGSVAHHNTDLYADTAPQDHYIPASFWVMGEAWLALHIMTHYRYTQDAGFLREHVDVMRQCVLFFADFLMTLPDGTLAACPTVSPENTYILPGGTRGCLCAGTAMDTEILHDLFSAYIEACGVLGICDDALTEAKEMLPRLPELKTGRYGQLLEWLEDYEEAEPGHRHISHLYGVYPSRRINRRDTPELLRAARVSLERRLAHGGGHTGWSRAWIAALWARFLDGGMAYEHLRELLCSSTFPNLMDSHPYGSGRVFQIDGNFGGCAAMVEMLVQTDGCNIALLPAMPEQFSEGEAKGLRLPGGLTLDMRWNDGKVTLAVITAERRRNVIVTVNGTERNVPLHPGENRIIGELPRK